MFERQAKIPPPLPQNGPSVAPNEFTRVDSRDPNIQNILTEVVDIQSLREAPSSREALNVHIALKPDAWLEEYFLLRDRITRRHDLFTLRIPYKDNPSVLAAYGIATLTDSMCPTILQSALEVPTNTPQSCADFFSKFVEPKLGFKVPHAQAAKGFYPSAFGQFQYGFYRDERDFPGRTTVALLMVETNPDTEHQGFASEINKQLLRWYRERGATYAFGLARLPGLSKMYQDPDIACDNLQEYVCRTRESDGLHIDTEIRFHQRSGAKIVCGVPYAAKDLQSHFHSAFVVYDLSRI